MKKFRTFRFFGFNHKMSNEQSEAAHMTHKQMSLILERLNQRTPSACHRCAQRQFSLQPGFGQIHLQEHSRDIHLGGGPMIPVVYIVCTNCGVVNSHALGALGLLDHPEFDLG